MPLFMIERDYADQLDVTPEVATALNEINTESGVRWVYSFLSADKKKTYCIYESPDPDALREAARRAGIPADAIVELVAKVEPDGLLTQI